MLANPPKESQPVADAIFPGSGSGEEQLPEQIPEYLANRLAEAARHAVLCRLMPVLRHDVAGAMQPPRMLLMVLQKNLQAAVPDLEAIAKNVASISTLTKQASVSCMSAFSWVAPKEDVSVSLRSGVDEAIGLLAMELSVNGLTLDSTIDHDAAVAPQAFLRSVLMGALLAFCDHHKDGGSLQVGFKPANAYSDAPGQIQVQLQRSAGAAANLPELQNILWKSRLIQWADVQAMAHSNGVPMTRGDGWLCLGLPRS